MLVTVIPIIGNSNSSGWFLPILFLVERVFERDFAFRLLGSFSGVSTHTDNADITVLPSLP